MVAIQNQVFFKANANQKVGTNQVEKNNERPKPIDITDKYSQDEIVDILKQVGTYKKSVYPARYTVEMYGDNLVINNATMTNDTTEIKEDGSVYHCGSWHNDEIAPAGSFEDIVLDAKQR